MKRGIERLLSSRKASQLAESSMTSGIGGAMTTGTQELGNIRGVLGQAGSNIWDVGRQGGYGGAAVTGALGFGAFGGASEWAQGGSFWGGAKSGFAAGALLGTAGRAARVGSLGHQWSAARGTGFKDTIAGYKNMYGGVSKQVEALARNAQDASKVLL